MTECTCVKEQDRYDDGSWARSYTVTLSPDCLVHMPEFNRIVAKRKERAA